VEIRRRAAKRIRQFAPTSNGDNDIEALRIGVSYDTTAGTLWKDGTYFPRGTRVMVTGLHIEQGFCVRFPDAANADPDDPLEAWEDWDEVDFLAEAGTVEPGGTLPTNILNEAQEVLDDAEDGCHLHLHEAEDD
jgi:hypothetical protein